MRLSLNSEEFCLTPSNGGTFMFGPEVLRPKVGWGGLPHWRGLGGGGGMTIALAKDVEDFQRDQVRGGVAAEPSELAKRHAALRGQTATPCAQQFIARFLASGRGTTSEVCLLRQVVDTRPTPDVDYLFAPPASLRNRSEIPSIARPWW